MSRSSIQTKSKNERVYDYLHAKFLRGEIAPESSPVSAEATRSGRRRGAPGGRGGGPR